MNFFVFVRRIAKTIKSAALQRSLYACLATKSETCGVSSGWPLANDLAKD